jgi:hypothetical protein
MNGSIRDTEYWDALNCNSSHHAADESGHRITTAVTMKTPTGMEVLGVFDDILEDSQHWPSLFSE